MITEGRTIVIGAGAGYSGDRIEPAIELARDGNVNYLIFECLAERTIALAQKERLQMPERGYDPLLEERMRRILPYIRDAAGVRRFRVITNMGAANPRSASTVVCRIAAELGLHGLRVAAVLGDDILGQIRGNRVVPLDNGLTPFELGDQLVSANAYLGAAGLVRALQRGADVIVTGRVADPSLFVAPQIYEFGVGWSDWATLGRATVVGHLLECAGQVTGGYFADPGFKDVPGLARLGFPIAEVSTDGGVIITKVVGSGGYVNTQTCSEQLLYEIQNPARYLTPDVTADFSNVSLATVGRDRVAIHGATGHRKPDSLKVTVGYLDGYVGEGGISYGGPGAIERAQLARSIVLDRIKIADVPVQEIRADLIGVDALYGARYRPAAAAPTEVRLRVAARCANADDASRIGREVEALYTNGPAGGGGATKSVHQQVAVASMLWPADRVRVRTHMEVAT